MADYYISVNPDEISIQDSYKLIIGSIVPRPIAFVSTMGIDASLNLAPFSFFTGVCSNPPTLLFSVMRRGSDGAKKDTLKNIEETGEFVVNVVSEDIVLPMNQTAAEYDYGVSEFEKAGLTPRASVKVKPPRVDESPIQMECVLNQLVPIGDGSIGTSTIVIGTIVQFHLRNDIYQNGHVLTKHLQPVARLAGSNYCPVREIFEVARPIQPA